jgi:2,4-dienoyl-CoA reductase-like NADH-dependent reductase (Old Yellow Enzyme family)
MTTKTVETLFRPLTIKGLTLKNRIVMAPMTRTFSPEGVPGQNVADYYRRRAESDVGLILSEGTVVGRSASKNHPNIPNFYGDAALAGWKNVIDAVHGAGGRMAPQIWHTGSTIADKNYAPDGIESPSGLLAPGKSRGKAMTDADIADTIAAFAQAAADAKRLGFDTVEIHGAHGYLIDEFFWAGTNERQDQWGGATIAERSRFAVEVTKAVRAAVGPDYPILFRASQWKQQDFSVRLATTPDEMASWLQPLVDAGVDVIHASQRRFWEPEFPEIDGEKGLNFAGWAKKLTGATTISVGSVGLSGEFIAAFGGESSKPASLDNLIERMERDEFDLIAVGRALLNDPQWVKKVEKGAFDTLKEFSPAALGELV